MLTVTDMLLVKFSFPIFAVVWKLAYLTSGELTNN